MAQGFAVCAAVACCVVLPAQARLRRPRRVPLELNVLGPTRPLSGTAWLLDRVRNNRRFGLRSEPLLGLLERYVEPERARAPEWRSFWRGRYGRNNFRLHPELTWAGPGRESATSNEWEPGFSTLALRAPVLDQAFDFSRAEVLPDWSLEVEAPEPEYHAIDQRALCPRWRLPRPVSVVRYDGAEWTRMALVDCQGAIAADALDRLSVLARPPATPKPDMPLPEEPEQDAAGGEWLPRVKLLNPRLIWVVQKIAEAFPKRSIFIMSGYRRDAHNNFHQQGRALDLYVSGVDNADVFRFCHTLSDVGCGFYPNNKFVHVDVRPFGTHRVAWVDISRPGQPSEYVTSWPGLMSGPEELSPSGYGE